MSYDQIRKSILEKSNLPQNLKEKFDLLKKP